MRHSISYIGLVRYGNNASYGLDKSMNQENIINKLSGTLHIHEEKLIVCDKTFIQRYTQMYYTSSSSGSNNLLEPPTRVHLSPVGKPLHRPAEL